MSFKTFPSYRIEDCEFCDCQTGQWAAAAAEIANEKHKQKTSAALMSTALIPTRFQNYTLGSYEAVAESDSQKKALMIARKLAETGKIQGRREARNSLYLYSVPTAGTGEEKSGYGVGKTALCTGIMLAWIEQGKRCLWYEAKALLSYMRLGIREGDYEDRKRRLKEVEVLLIDDLGEVWKSEEKDTGREAITEIIAHRHDWELPTLITSNLSIETMEKQYSAKVAERIAEMCLVMEVVGPNLRKRR